MLTKIREYIEISWKSEWKGSVHNEMKKGMAIVGMDLWKEQAPIAIQLTLPSHRFLG